jgi:N-acetylmuramic acid 6-phosphate etherase
MIRVGKTYGNLMVDVRATNEKLRERAVRIVEQAAGVDVATARTALTGAGHDVKAAILMLVAGIGPEDAAARLARHGGRLRAALDGPPCA